jgi:putative ABC transport system ATP-binding protein
MTASHRTPVAKNGTDSLTQHSSSQGVGFEVEIDGLSFRPFRDPGKDVLQNVSLSVRPGEFVAIVGPNGAGKSSILRAIAGEIQPTSGVARVAGQIINRPINQIIDGVGVVHQVEDTDLIDHLTIAHNISIRQLLGGGHTKRFWAMSSAWKREIAMILGSHSVARFDLNRMVGTLSGGEKQVLGIAIATYLEHRRNPCRLLLLDEHTSRLDPRNADIVMKYTREQVHATQATTLMVTHRYKDALEGTNRILIVRNGKITHDKKSGEDAGGIKSVEELSRLVEESTGQ